MKDKHTDWDQNTYTIVHNSDRNNRATVCQLQPMNPNWVEEHIRLEISIYLN